MTQEEKQLLLIDLCARLPYGVKVNAYSYSTPQTLYSVDVFRREYTLENNDSGNLFVGFDKHIFSNIKPYLRPMSSMTEEEKADLEAYSKQELDKYADDVLNGSDEDTIRYSQVSLIYKDIDWYNAHHIDYRGLIPMGLALEAPRDMYNTKTK